MIDLSHDAWLTIGAGITAAASVAAAWLSRTSATAAQEARDLSRPTGIGFAGDVRQGLAQLAGAVERIEKRQAAESVARTKNAELLAEHLADHARSSWPTAH